jgi:hypothetical protein
MLLPTIVLFATLAVVVGSPAIKLGSTTVNGLNLPELGVEFFGGRSFLTIH